MLLLWARVMALHLDEEVLGVGDWLWYALKEGEARLWRPLGEGEAKLGRPLLDSLCKLPFGSYTCD